MTLWTIQPEEVWEILQSDGVFRCDPGKSSMLEWRDKYEWLIQQMISKIGQPPEGVIFPIWAWYMQNGNRKRPDLRSARWYSGDEDQPYVCIEIDVREDQVVLSDFDEWCVILLDGLLTESEDESEALEKHLEEMDAAERRPWKEKNWERVFDLTPMDNGWTRRGEDIQATFWELRKEHVRDVRFFRTGKKRHSKNSNAAS